MEGPVVSAGRAHPAAWRDAQLPGAGAARPRAARMASMRALLRQRAAGRPSPALLSSCPTPAAPPPTSPLVRATCSGWVKPCFAASDAFMLRSAGLDALVGWPAAPCCGQWTLHRPPTGSWDPPLAPQQQPRRWQAPSGGTRTGGAAGMQPPARRPWPGACWRQQPSGGVDRVCCPT